jgi:N-acetylglutamate synthase-like GNAT family acetyltransferase
MSAPGRSPADLGIDDNLRGEPLRSDEIEAFRLALVEAGLPADDIAATGVQPFRFERDLKRVGYGALEVYGSAVLLRSIVVATDARGEGVGRAITEWLLAHAGALGAGRAFLFTTNARAYFEGIGFEVVDRSTAPQSILMTRQAIGLCPASAVLLTRTVTP